MRDLNDMLLFAAVAQYGSFTAAARRTGVPKATVSRKIADLERRLGVRLLQRTTRRVSITEAGAAFYEHCRRIVEEVEAAESTATRLHGSARGVLRIAAPSAITSQLLAPLLPGFLASYPEVAIELLVVNEGVDILERGVDLLVTGRPLPESNFPVRLLLRLSTGLYAAPSYLARRQSPTSPGDLGEHRTLVFSQEPKRAGHSWTLSKGDRVVVVQVRPVVVANDLLPLLDAAAAGVGIVLTPESAITPAMKAGQLVRVLPDWAGPPIEARAMFPSRQAIPAKVRAFLDHLVRTTQRMGSQS